MNKFITKLITFFLAFVVCVPVTGMNTFSAQAEGIQRDQAPVYGNWSGDQVTTGSVTASDTCRIISQKTKYKYYHYVNAYDGYTNNIDSIPYGTNEYYHECELDSQLTAISFQDKGGKQAYGYYACPTDSFHIWFYSGTVTYTTYQTRTKTIPTSTPAPASTNTVVTTNQSMYRLYNPNSGEHFYTNSTEERNTLITIGWNYEGLGWTAPSSSNTPVYRMYNPNAGEHHYTMSTDERDMLTNAGWNYEGIGWYSDDAKAVPLYREYNPNAYSCNHNYTSSGSENDWLVGLGWQAEGIGWYGVNRNTPSVNDIYSRLINRGYTYTTSDPKYAAYGGYTNIFKKYDGEEFITRSNDTVPDGVVKGFVYFGTNNSILEYQSKGEYINIKWQQGFVLPDWSDASDHEDIYADGMVMTGIGGTYDTMPYDTLLAQAKQDYIEMLGLLDELDVTESEFYNFACNFNK